LPRLSSFSTKSFHIYASIGSKPANISAAAANVFSGTQSHTVKNFCHAASTASRDFHSNTSMIVPSRARMMVGS